MAVATLVVVKNEQPDMSIEANRVQLDHVTKAAHVEIARDHTEKCLAARQRLASSVEMYHTWRYAKKALFDGPVAKMQDELEITRYIDECISNTRLVVIDDVRLLKNLTKADLEVRHNLIELGNKSKYTVFAYGGSVISTDVFNIQLGAANVPPEDRKVVDVVHYGEDGTETLERWVCTNPEAEHTADLAWHVYEIPTTYKLFWPPSDEIERYRKLAKENTPEDE